MLGRSRSVVELVEFERLTRVTGCVSLAPVPWPLAPVTRPLTPQNRSNEKESDQQSYCCAGGVNHPHCCNVPDNGISVQVSSLQPRIDLADDPGQLPLFPDPVPESDAHGFSFGCRVEFPGRVDAELVDRLARASRRLRRGGVIGAAKLRRLTEQVEKLANLFDGVR